MKKISEFFIIRLLVFGGEIFNIQSNFNGSNIFGTIENCSGHG